MGINSLPEVKLARLIHKKHNLVIPFDLDALIREYATLIYKYIPITGVDGVCINLKTPGKKPKIVVNSNLPPARQVFTLAHELGHLIIPWHTGTIVDDIYNNSHKQILYAIIEQEANHFAAEILMPYNWVRSQYNLSKDISNLYKTIVDTVNVSAQASAIKIAQVLRPEIIYLAVKNGYIINCGKTLKTSTSLPKNGSKFSINIFPHISSHTIYNNNGVDYHWIDLKGSISICVDDDPRSWKDILNDIAIEINPIEGIEKFKKSINGKVSFANGLVKSSGDYTVENVITACYYRLTNNCPKEFTSHKDFKKFIKLRSEGFVNK